MQSLKMTTIMVKKSNKMFFMVLLLGFLPQMIFAFPDDSLFYKLYPEYKVYYNLKEALKDPSKVYKLDLRRVRSMKKVSKFKNLKLLRSSFSGSSLRGLDSLVNLEYLALFSAGERKISVLEMDNLKKLKHLEFRAFKHIQDVSVIGNLENLETLSLPFNHIKDISFISKLKNLKALELLLNDISNMQALEDLTLLEYLSMDDNPITSIESVRNLVNLEELCLYRCGLELDNLLPLTKLHKLKVLDVSENNIKSLEGIEELKDLDFLMFQYNMVASLKSIENLKNLRTIMGLYNNIHISEEDIDLLMNIPTLKTAYLDGFSIGLLPSSQKEKK
jgi:Leucine-rich repeat (LRR) protein